MRDSGYPNEPWLLTSVMHAEPDTLESHFNSCHMTTRNYVECCIGVWKEWFRIHHKSMCSFGQHSSLPQSVPLPQNIQMEDEEHNYPIAVEGHYFAGKSTVLLRASAKHLSSLLIQVSSPSKRVSAIYSSKASLLQSMVWKMMAVGLPTGYCLHAELRISSIQSDYGLKTTNFNEL
ncbi:hypothetical protein J437_LFUL011975 [Ladona fulva]|uniref:Uncharacterized protein n=1 Tax=Ladona fulva TaxID=123851 RepID=A0A8K0KDK7_LADFU|nr:hypothetical protein J437_LFUL011975 [Ladona fulva]